MAQTAAKGPNSPDFTRFRGFLATVGRCTAVSSTPCPTNVPNSPSVRTRTPPDLKWLLNERAAIAGEIGKTYFHQKALAPRLAALQRKVDAITALMLRCAEARESHQVTLDALDASIGLAYSRVEPSAGGVVYAWAGKYGKRGALTQFILQTLKDASPAAVDTIQLINQVVLHFQLTLPFPSSRRSLRTSVKTALYCLARARLVEPLHGTARGIPGVWRWKQPATLVDLAVRAAAIAKAAVDEAARANGGRPDAPHAHPSRHQVAAQ